MASEARYVLQVGDLVTGYGKKRVLNGVGLDVHAGEIVAIIGHNGAGKTTLLKAVFGLLPVWEGSVSFDENPSDSRTPRKLLRQGVAYVPQGNRVFSDLTVRENLEMGGVMLRDRRALKERIEHVFTLFPALQDRLRQRAGTLSGGEKQMLALANAIVLSPRLLLLDEPSLGLAPPLVSDALGRIQQIAKDNDVAILIVEQKVREVLKIAQRVYVLRNGVVSYSGSTDSLRDEAVLRRVYL